MSWRFKVSFLAAPQNQWSNQHHRQDVWLPVQYQSPAQQPARYHCFVLPCQALPPGTLSTGRYQQAFGSNCFQESYCKMFLIFNLLLLKFGVGSSFLFHYLVSISDIIGKIRWVPPCVPHQHNMTPVSIECIRIWFKSISKAPLIEKWKHSLVATTDRIIFKPLWNRSLKIWFVLQPSMIQKISKNDIIYLSISKFTALSIICLEIPHEHHGTQVQKVQL